MCNGDNCEQILNEMQHVGANKISAEETIQKFYEILEKKSVIETYY